MSGLLTLVFKSGSGRAVQTTPTETGIVKTSGSLVVTAPPLLPSRRFRT